MVDGYSTNYRRQTDINTSLYNPSFSSTLLDTIYRSIDQGEEQKLGMRTNQSVAYGSDGGVGANLRGVFRSEEEMANFQRACMIEKWMEKKAGEKVAVRGNSAADLGMKKPRKDRENSTSSSSDSSCGGGDFFSSSEAESFPVQRPKPIRTGLEKEKNHRDSESEFHRRERRGFGGDVEQKPKHEGGFLKTKSRALKIYGDLKKVKQPISPGGKLAGFLNSIFAGGNLKKPKTTANGDYSPSLKSANASTCSSASSFSRSCLSKTPSSGGSKPSNGAKRSVRFSPVSVIVDDKVNNNNNYNKKQTSKFTTAANNNNNNKNNINSLRNVINEELMVHVMDKNRRVEDAARDLLRNYHRKNQVGCEFDSSFDHLRKPQVIKNNQIINQNFDEEDDDAASCASSDLFELDNLSAIGMERYRQELPVYETTHL